MPVTKTCRCGNPFEQYLSTQTKCTPCLIKKGAEIKKKQERKEHREAKERIKSLSEYEADARRVFQKWVRLRDEHLPCISCGGRTRLNDAGHYFDAGIYSGLIFHPDNVHKQCSYNCNKMLHGNKANYRIGLVKKIGEEKVRWLEDNKDRLRNYKYTKDELLEIKKKYQLKIKLKDYGI